MVLKRKILLVSGKIFSGKDYTADCLVKKNGWKKLSFAENLKLLCSEKYKTPVSFFYTHTGKSLKYDATRTYRDLLVETSYSLKKHNEDYFVEKIIGKIEQDRYSNFVIPDFRFPNEYTRIKKDLSRNFAVNTCIVVRPDNNNNSECPSENSLSNFPFDFTIVNNGDDKTILKTIKEFYTEKA
jgi:hypothetical protein